MILAEMELNEENAVAGSILVDARCMKLIPKSLRDTDFQSVPCRTVYQAARSLEQEHLPIDAISVKRWAEAHGVILPDQTLKEWQEITPSVMNIGLHARRVHENGLLRASWEAAEEAKADIGTPYLEKMKRLIETLQNIMSHAESDIWISADQVPYEPPRWLIEPYVPMGKGTLIQADPGTGKTALVCALAAAVTTGQGFLGLKVSAPGDVLMLSTEDDQGVLRGRIEANGGIPNRVHFVAHAAGMTLNSPEIADGIRRYRAKLLIFDPFQAFLGAGVDLFRANETRPILAQLFETCTELGCACVIVAHLGKVTQGKSAVNQSLGSVDIPGAMRSILHVARNPSMEGELLAFHIKSSNAPRGKAIAYSIQDRGGVLFHGFSDLTLEEITSVQREKIPPYEKEPLVEVLCRWLAENPKGGFLSYEDVQKEYVRQLGIPFGGTVREMRARLEVPELRRRLMNERNVQLLTRERTSSARGIRLQTYTHPEGFQTQLPLKTGNDRNDRNDGIHTAQAPGQLRSSSANDRNDRNDGIHTVRNPDPVQSSVPEDLWDGERPPLPEPPPEHPVFLPNFDDREYPF